MNPRLTLIALVLLTLLGDLSACKESRKETTQDTQGKADQEQIIVGRVTFLEKTLFRYLRDIKDWTLAFRDVPVTAGDVLYSAVQGRSEITFPNDTKLRLNDSTKIQVDSVKGNLTSVYLHSGAVRIQNRGADTFVKVETPYGQVISRQPSTFDVVVGPSSAVVTSINGTGRFVDAKDKHYELKPESNSLLADKSEAVSFRQDRDPKWDEWNNERDTESRNGEKDPSPHLPSQLQSETKALADNGRWEEVTHEGETTNLWTPTKVGPDWSPFTVGQWTTWNEEQLWVPYEPFGWVTHHYGGWAFARNRWYWRPPLVAGWRVLPWYPARAVWVHHGRYVGWVPCGWREVYYGRRYWGPRTVIVGPGYIRNVEIRRYVNVNKTVIIDRERLYSARGRYEPVKDARIAKEVVNSGRAAAGATGAVVRDVDTRMAHHFARSGDFSHKPQFADAKPFETRQARVGGDNVKALGDGIRKANLHTPAARTNQPLPPVEKTAREMRRDIPTAPQKSAQVQGPARGSESIRGSKSAGSQGQQQLQPQRPQQAQNIRQQQQQTQAPGQQKIQQQGQQQVKAQQQRNAQQQQTQAQQQRQQQNQAQQQQQQLHRQQAQQQQQHQQPVRQHRQPAQKQPQHRKQ